MQRPFAIATLLLTMITAPSHAVTAHEKLDAQQRDIGTTAFTAHDYRPGTVQHIVLFRYKNSVTPAQIKETRERFLALKDEARRDGKPYILRLEAGAQNSGEGVDHGFQEGFIVTFASEGDRNYYVGTPVVSDPRFYDAAHQRFKDFVGPLLAEKDGVLVFDFNASEA
ncbi:Dabb family protein [Falsochrobactrum sp. TDYN1]|uniref:Dabb family protein n=1 Tax=Falsochrobactrum tianjinense TaxID=2706015 RepID=A0A949PKI8_9HYPH|nr:Dabb family protein [Falsochrobactrum sp. TDYN1]MBV2141955.1 Dabb family protein [Falsochrobactrum sp. TDYN1]